MPANYEDEYLTVKEIAEHLKLNPQTLRNWIDQGQLPAVRIGRRVRVRRTDLERLLEQGRTSADVTAPAVASPVAQAGGLEELAMALSRAQRLLGRRSAARRAELAEGLQDLTEAVSRTVRDHADRPPAGSDQA